MRYISRMWDNLGAGRSFDVIVVVVANAFQRDRLRRHLQRPGGWSTVVPEPTVHVASLDELGRPWRGGNFDASLFAIQRVRRLLTQRAVPEGEGRCLAVLAAGHGTRAYPLTAAEGGNKSMIRTPAQVGRHPLRVVELVLAQYHQILDEVEPGRIHVAAGDHLLTWTCPPGSRGGQHVQVFANSTSFMTEARAASLIDTDLEPRWHDPIDLRSRLSRIDVASRLPVLHSLTQMGLVKASEGDDSLLYLVEKAGVADILETFAESGAKARVNWWDWSLSPDAARLVSRTYADLIGTGIDFSMDVLEPVTMDRETWRRRRPSRNPDLWERANALFQNPTRPRTTPLGPIGVADPGEGSAFADLGTLKSMYDAFTAALEMTERGEHYRRLMGARLEEGALFVGEKPPPGVEVEPGSIVIGGSGIHSGRVGQGSIVVDPRVGELRTSGRSIAYGVWAPRTRVTVRDGEVAAGVLHRGRRLTVRASLLGLPKRDGDPAAWNLPQYGNAMSFSDLYAGVTSLELGSGRRLHRRDWTRAWTSRRQVSWRGPGGGRTGSDDAGARSDDRRTLLHRFPRTSSSADEGVDKEP